MENYKSVDNWKPRKEFIKMTDERILKKIGKLLTLYGVEEEEKEKFLADVQDAKYDDDVEEVVEKDEVPAAPVVEEKEEEIIDEELPTNEGVEEEAPVEQETEVDYKAQYEELKGVIDGLVARIEPLENIVAKLGVPDEKEEQPFGVEPQAESEKDESLSYFDEINRRRTGRN